MYTKVNICCITDNAFITPTIVMLQSVKENKHATTEIDAHCIITSGLDEFWISCLQSLEAKDFHITIVQREISSAIPFAAYTKVPPIACLKFDIPDILPNLDKVIYIDGDIIVQKDLCELFNIDLGNCYAAATRDIGAEISRKFHELLQLKRYFNSGVMLLNLTQMRKHDIPAKLLKCKLEAPSTWKCQDQDSFNYIFAENVIFLPLKYNSCIPLIKARSFDIQTINTFYNTQYRCWNDAQHDAVLLHLAGTGGRRPWQVVNGSYALQWEYYYLKSPLRHIELIRKSQVTPTDTAVVKQGRIIKLLSQRPKLKRQYRLLQLKLLFALGNRRRKLISKRENIKKQLNELKQLIASCI